MLTVEQLKYIEQTPNENDISLRLLAIFYEKYISNRIYELEMENDTILVFTTKNQHFPHLIGLHKFYDRNHTNKLLHSKKQLKSDKGFNNLKNSKITFQDLKNIAGSTKRYNNYKKRILNFPFTYQLLRKSKFISYDKEKVNNNTKIPGNYVFVNNIGTNKLHFFFIDETNNIIDDGITNENKDYSVVSLLLLYAFIIF